MAWRGVSCCLAALLRQSTKSCESAADIVLYFEGGKKDEVTRQREVASPTEMTNDKEIRKIT